MLHQKFLQKVISEILEKSSDLSGFSFIIPGKRPVVFIKEILKEKNYNGIFPEFFTIDELVHKISQTTRNQRHCTLAFCLSNLYSTLSRRRFGEFPEMVPNIAKRLGRYAEIPWKRQRNSGMDAVLKNASKTGAKIWAMKKALEEKSQFLEKNECFSPSFYKKN